VQAAAQFSEEEAVSKKSVKASNEVGARLLNLWALAYDV